MNDEALDSLAQIWPLIQTDPCLFADRFLPFNEKGVRWKFNRYQRRVIAAMFRRHFSIRLWSEPKKSGKTLVAAVLGLWWAIITPNTEIIVAANDLDQSVGRVFATMVALIQRNAGLLSLCTIRAEHIIFKNGTLVSAIASDYRGAAGSRHSLVLFDELWGYSLENSQRLFEELTPPPTEQDAWTLIVTYAGFTGESQLLERFYKQGLLGERTDEELETYESPDLFMFWSHTARQPWQTPKYYASQEAILRENTFKRLHRNEWVTSQSTFLTPELYDPCVDPEHRPLLPSRNEDEYVGVDIGLKSDNGAVVRVRRRDDRLILAGYRLWKPSGQEPLDLESTVEAYLREIASQGNVRAVLVDPWQAARTIATLKAAGIPIEEFPQTVGNTSRMGSTLYDLLKGRNLKLFADEDLRQQAMNTIAIETPRGFRISKEKASRKIDAIVALSMACVAALDRPTAHFDAYDPTPDVDAIIPTIVRGDAEDKQEIDASIVRRMTNGGWFER